MFLPLGTDQTRRRPTVVTYWLIGLCMVLFLVEYTITRTRPDLAQRLFEPLVFHPGNFRWWQPITYQFLHGSAMHVAMNMLFLFVFGPDVEGRFRRLGFLAFFLLSGVIAAGAQYCAGSGNPMIGASGSVAGVTGAFLVMFPLVSVRMLFFFFLIGVYSIPAWWFIAASIVKDLVLHIGAAHTGIAYAAHLGGYLFGFTVAMTLLWLKIIPREPFDLFSMGRQAHRRRQFKELSTGRAGAPWRRDAATRGPIAVSDKALSARPDSPPDPRFEIVRHVEQGRIGEAATRYESALAAHPALVLDRSSQLAVANQLVAEGRHAAASTAYTLFLQRFPEDREASDVRLMHAILLARYLGDPASARALLARIDAFRLDADSAQLAKDLTDELGV